VSSPAIFLDRDGTLVHPRHYPSQPDDLILYDGIGPELAALQMAGFRLVVVTNQSGIARGFFTETDLARMHDHLAFQLARFTVRIDGIYFCPHHPDGVVAPFATHCSCRKPRSGMVTAAARELDLDPRRSWFVGDILDDVEAGNRAGCRSILVDLGTEPEPTEQLRVPTFVGRTTLDALRIVAAVEGVGPATGLTYRPPRWRADLAPSIVDHATFAESRS
jgi:D-glycero-D-manno-heptose 1,7-bisphosphate phosphatase